MVTTPKAGGESGSATIVSSNRGLRSAQHAAWLYTGVCPATKARTRALLLVIAALGTIGCDRVTKSAASAYLAGIPDRSFLSDTIRVGYVENTGGFLSVGADLPPIARDAVFTARQGSC